MSDVMVKELIYFAMVVCLLPYLVVLIRVIAG